MNLNIFNTEFIWSVCNINDSSDFYSLKAREEEYREANQSTISLLSFQLDLQNYNEVDNTPNKLLNYLREHYRFGVDEDTNLKEGFLETNSDDKEITCFYARQSPVKLTYAFDYRKLHTNRYKLITPQNSIKVKIIFTNKKINILLFGAHDVLMKRCLTKINQSFRSIYNIYFDLTYSRISQKDMKKILDGLMSVSYIWISPGESEKFIKYVEKQVGNEIKKIPEFIVHNKLYGLRLKRSQFVMDTIREQGIELNEIQGRISLYGSRLTIRVSSSGKIIFWIPNYVIPIDKTPYDMAEIYYKQILSDTPSLITQKTLREWFSND